jgi:serine/threonine protein kinase
LWGSVASLASGHVLDGYHLGRFIGRGGFGDVWLCGSELMGGYRALKFRLTRLLEGDASIITLYSIFQVTAARL